jgi:hypothetical protein
MDLWSVVVFGAQFTYCLVAAWAVVRFVDPFVVRFSDWWDKQFVRYD